MQHLNLPAYEYKIKQDKDSCYIFDPIRKKYLALTPEEWVRQHLVFYLVHHLKYPSGLVSLEAGIKVNKLSRRYDALVYSNKSLPLVLIECKAPEVKINQKVFDQALAYNTVVKAPFVIISNGLQHYFFKVQAEGKVEFKKNIPLYTDIISG